MSLTDFEKNVLGATGYEENGQVVRTQSQPSFLDQPIPEPKKKSWLGKAASAVGNFAVGVGKGATDTILSVPRNVEKVVKETQKLGTQKKMNKLREQVATQSEELLELYRNAPAGSEQKEKYAKLIRQNTEQMLSINDDEDEIMDTIDRDASWIPGDYQGEAKRAVDDAYATKNKAQQVGFKAEKIGEFLIPSAKIAKADKAISGMKLFNSGSKAANFANATARVGAKAGLEGTAAAATSLGQSAYQGRLDTAEGRKGALKEAKTNALFAGGTKALFAGGGEILNAVKAPRKLAQATYKLDDTDVAKLIKEGADDVRPTGSKVVTIGDKTLQGVDDVAKSSDETLADWAVRNKLKGSALNQAKQVAEKIDATEKAVMKTAEAAKKRIVVDPGLKAFADEMADEYAGYGRGEIAGKVQDFLTDIGDDGTVSVKEAIKFRRLVDQFRTSASFRNPKVADNMKYWADDLRIAVNNVDGIGGLNKDYSMALRAAEALMKKAKSEGNKQLVGALEMYTVGLPAVSDANSLFGAGLVAGKRLLNSPRMQMGLGRTIQDLGNSTTKGVAARRIIPEVVRDMSEDELQY